MLRNNSDILSLNKFLNSSTPEISFISCLTLLLISFLSEGFFTSISEGDNFAVFKSSLLLLLLSLSNEKPSSSVIIIEYFLGEIISASGEKV